MRSDASVRVSRNSASPSRPRLDAIWSMMPTGAPTKSFSAARPALASATSSSGSAKRVRSARSTLISSAALDESPPPIGTVDVEVQVEPGKIDLHPCQRDGQPLNVVEPAASRRLGTERELFDVRARPRAPRTDDAVGAGR